jgi:hypothetical protein
MLADAPPKEVSMRRYSVMLVASAIALAVSPANAALKKYIFNNTSYDGQGGAPHISRPLDTSTPAPGNVALIDTAIPGSPQLRKLVDTGNGTITVPVPALAIGIFLSNNDRTGPGLLKHLHDTTGPDGSGPIFTGTGSVAAGQTIRWGLTTGWSVTGSQWCHSVPAIICTFADRMDQATTDPPNEADFFGGAYDLGTWYFHGTGFTSQGFIQQYYSAVGGPPGGNNLFVFRGTATNDGTVPAIAILGVGVLGLSLATGGAVALRRSKR